MAYEYIKYMEVPTAELVISKNDTYDVLDKATVIVDVDGAGIRTVVKELTVEAGVSTYTFEHGLKTKDVYVQLYKNETLSDVEIDVYRDTTTSIRVTFREEPEEGTKYKVLILYGASSSSVIKHTLQIVASVKEYEITHNLNNQDMLVQVYDLATFNTVMVDVIRTTVNKLTIKFATMPEVGKQYRVLITSKEALSIVDNVKY